MERWQMNRFGFVNFWIYDLEEFEPENGKILIRGSNGSGKSITTQSFIPYILDADRQPTRLDPFGSKDRQMAYYLIGDPEAGKDESTGYIWMEFIKPESKQYRTIGIGLHAKKSGKMNTWGFCLTDGRRIGKDFLLYKEVGTQIIPHDPRTLKKELGEQNIFTERPTEYKLMVAEKIFGIPKDRIDDFDQLTNILIKTRSSKLASKENLKPAGLYEILNESLRTLSDDDLRPMTDAMSKIEEAHHKIEMYLSALAEANTVAEEYDRYNRYMLWIKSKRYLDKHSECCHARQELEQLQQNMTQKLEQADHAQHRWEEAKRTLNNLHLEQNNLDISDIQEYLRHKDETERQLAENKKTADAYSNQINQKQQSIGRKYAEHTKKQDQLDETTTKLTECLQKLADYEDDLFPFYHSFIATLQKEEPLPYEQYQNEINRFRKKISQACQQLKNYETLTAQYKSEQQKLAEQNERLTQAFFELQVAQEQWNEQKDELIERLYMAAKTNIEYRMDERLVRQIEDIISGYEGDGSSGEYQKLLSTHYIYLHSAIINELNTAKSDCTIKQNVCDDLQRQLEELKHSQEPAPERSELRLAARKALSENGIAYRSFYECVDFQPDIPEEVKTIIEAEIAAMGMLDALVIADGQQQAAETILSDFSDSYFLTEVKEPYQSDTCFCVAAEPAFARPTQQILTSLASHTALSLEGYYQNGMLGGHALPETTGGFIGAESRKKYRKSQIAALQQQLVHAQSVLQETKQTLDTVINREKALKHEYDQMIDISQLNTTLNQLCNQQRIYDHARQDGEEQEQRCQNVQAALNLSFRQAEELCREFPYYPKTSRDYTIVLNNIDGFSPSIMEAITLIRSKQSIQTLLNEIVDTIEEAENDKDQLFAQHNRINKQIGEHQDRLTMYEQFLNAPENRDKTRRYDEINVQISTLTQQQSDCQKEIAVANDRIQNYKTAIEHQQLHLTNLLTEEEHLQQYFQEELDRKFVLVQNNKTVLQSAEEAKTVIRKGDEQKSVSDISARLMNATRSHSNILSAEYKLMNDTLFEDSGPDTIRSRTRITLFWKGKTVSPAVFREELEQLIQHDRALLKKDEENMFKEILLNTISKKLSNRIRESSEWVQQMSTLMEKIDTSMGLVFQLQWVPKKDRGENELQFDELNKLLMKDKQWIDAEDIDRLTNHFRSKIEYERRLLEEKGADANYADIVKNVLDFRNWFEFHLRYKEPKMDGFRNLTTSRFNKFSGGERALSLYIPLFAAVAAQYEKAGPQAPRLLALDEAFAGVDESNISQMFALLEKLQFGYIINSQALWGCYDTVPALAIAELFHDKVNDLITVISYQWNGKQKMLAE